MGVKGHPRSTLSIVSSRFVLVHSPLVGPTTWSPVADALTASGHAVTVPSLLGMPAGPPPRWRHGVETVVRQVWQADEPLVLVGHSGAGLLLPAIGHTLGDRIAAYLFVDAALPPPSGEVAAVPRALLDHLKTRAIDGRLPPWSEWWGDGAMAALVPEPAIRERLAAEMPRLPLSYFEEVIAVPNGWEQTASGYLQFSAVYDAEANEAQARGFLIEKMPGGHLQMVVDPVGVAERIVALAVSLGVVREQSS